MVIGSKKESTVYVYCSAIVIPVFNFSKVVHMTGWSSRPDCNSRLAGMYTIGLKEKIFITVYTIGLKDKNIQNSVFYRV